MPGQGEGTRAETDGQLIYAEIVFYGTTLILSNVTEPLLKAREDGQDRRLLALLVANAQGAFDRALASGCSELRPVTKLDDGVMTGVLMGLFNHFWVVMCRATEAMINVGREGTGHGRGMAAARTVMHDRERR